MDNYKIAFTQFAISDIQATIRAIDVKVGALLVLVLAPFSAISKVFYHIDKLCCCHPKFIFIVISVAFFATWLLALTSLVRAISALDNPACHIINSQTQKGTFYGGGLYIFGILDALFNRDIIKANKDVATFSKDIPCTEEDIALELVFEQMKVIYIRDIKANRLKWGIRFASSWLILGICIYLSSRYLVGCWL
jgi:hypothetical protein